MIEYIIIQDIAIYSFLQIHEGYLICEKYFNPKFHGGKKHPINSCTKCIVSALLGIANDQGFIQDIDQEPKYTSNYPQFVHFYPPIDYKTVLAFLMSSTPITILLFSAK